MHEEKSPADGTRKEMDGNKDNYQDEKFQIDVSQIIQNFLPVHTAEEKEEENEGEEKDYS